MTRQQASKSNSHTTPPAHTTLPTHLAPTSVTPTTLLNLSPNLLPALNFNDNFTNLNTFSPSNCPSSLTNNTAGFYSLRLHPNFVSSFSPVSLLIPQR
uniref:Ovule protein n=1 Tax=Mesocestoides corti TaxID=53468 RepID=A0A5K3FYZ0_MESCO